MHADTTQSKKPTGSANNPAGHTDSHTVPNPADAGKAFIEQQRTVEINDVGRLCHEHGRCHCKRSCQHATHHDFEIHFSSGAGKRQGFGKSARFVELDIDCIIFAHEFVQIV